MIRSTPIVFIMSRCRFQFLLKMNVAAWMLEKVKSTTAPSESSMAVQPLMVDCSERAIFAKDRRNDKELVTLAHCIGIVILVLVGAMSTEFSGKMSVS